MHISRSYLSLRITKMESHDSEMPQAPGVKNLENLDLSFVTVLFALSSRSQVIGVGLLDAGEILWSCGESMDLVWRCRQKQQQVLKGNNRGKSIQRTGSAIVDL
jgi:hypothetical protein